MSQNVEQLPALSELVDTDSFREVCRRFTELFGIGIRIFDQEGKKLTDIRASTSDHCGYLFTVHPTKVLCTNLVNEVRTCPLKTSGEVVERDCFSGLRYKVKPIIYEGTLMGRVIFGPYAPDGLKQSPAALEKHSGDGLDLEVLNGYLKEIPRAGEAPVGRVLDTVSRILDVIIHSSFKTYMTSQIHIASIAGAFDDLEKAHDRLKDANTHLKDLDRLKSNFIATVSHELRTPLTSVIGYSEMLLEGMAGSLNDEQSNYVQTILEKGESLLNLIGQVLDLSRIESGNVVMRKEKTDPRECVRFAVSDVTPQANKRNLELDVDIAEEVTPSQVDSDKVRRVVTNLLGNAVKFTSPGGTVTVAVDLTEAPPVGSDRFDIFQPERNQFLRIAVSDTGIGIPEDKQKRVFDSFFQVDNSSTREFGGSGLGLSIVRNFVQAHGGRMDLKSEVGQGSTFTVLLPYHPEPPTADVGVDGIGHAELR